MENTTSCVESVIFTPSHHQVSLLVSMALATTRGRLQRSKMLYNLRQQSHCLPVEPLAAEERVILLDVHCFCHCFAPFVRNLLIFFYYPQIQFSTYIKFRVFYGFFFFFFFFFFCSASSILLMKLFSLCDFIISLLCSTFILFVSPGIIAFFVAIINQQYIHFYSYF